MKQHKVIIVMMILAMMIGFVYAESPISKYIAKSDEDIEVIKDPWVYYFSDDGYGRRIYFKNKKSGTIMTYGEDTDSFKSYRTKNPYQLRPIVYIGEWEYDKQLGRTIRMIRRQNVRNGDVESTYETKDEVNEKIPAMDWNMVRTINDGLNTANNPRRFIQMLRTDENKALVKKLEEEGYYIYGEDENGRFDWGERFTTDLDKTDPYIVEASGILHPRVNLERKYMTIDEQKVLEKKRDEREAIEKPIRQAKYRAAKKQYDEIMAREDAKRKWYQAKRKKPDWEGYGVWA